LGLAARIDNLSCVDELSLHALKEPLGTTEVNKLVRAILQAGIVGFAEHGATASERSRLSS
jgi:hypothetical protein